MREIIGDIWDFHKQLYWIVITTNGTVKKDGRAVMGRGIALQAIERFENLPYALARGVKEKGNIVFALWGFGLISFPVKHNWWESASLDLIEESCKQLREVADKVLNPNSYCLEDQQTLKGKLTTIYMVRPGCGAGGLDWKDVKPILER